MIVFQLESDTTVLMLMDPSHKKSMPDIATSEMPDLMGALEWVGMEKISLPIVLSHGAQVLCNADVFVNLAKEDAKGIHMSRLYMSLQKGLEHQRVSLQGIKTLLQDFVDSQAGLATAARLVLRWQELHKRKALLSDNKGWKEYPVEIEAELVNGKFNIDVKFSLFYSSTCPCSAALARQLYQQEFSKEFCDDNITFEKVHLWLGKSRIATPHSQRSRADVSLSLNDATDDDVVQVIPFIDRIEEDLSTPVQSAVKREDEQEFARLNGENAMFVEDALRIIKNSLESFKSVKQFRVKTHHYESLHAHDAVGSIVSS